MSLTLKPGGFSCLALVPFYFKSLRYVVSWRVPCCSMKSRTIIILTAQLVKPAVSLLHFRSICRELTVVDQIRIEQKAFGAMLGPSWGQVGAMLGPCWGQVGAMLGFACWLVFQ